MDITVQNLQEFEDNGEYGSFLGIDKKLGIGNKAKKIEASTSQIKADTEKLKADTIAQNKALAEQIKANELATQEAIRKADALQSGGGQVPTSGVIGSTDTPPSPMSKMKLPLIIGGVVLVGIVLVVALRK
jgi:hypothetical protein